LFALFKRKRLDVRQPDIRIGMPVARKRTEVVE